MTDEQETKLLEIVEEHGNLMDKIMDRLNEVARRVTKLEMILERLGHK